MNRVVDRGAITAAYVGIGVAITVVASFQLIIPIEWVIWLLAFPTGLLIGYYANTRSNRRHGPWAKILVNGLFAGFVTGATAAALLLLVKVIFFYADSGYPDFNRIDQGTGQPIPPYCQTGADCVYSRYLLAGKGSDLAAAGVTDAASFTAVYWREQLATATTLLVITTVGGLGGAVIYGVVRPRPTVSEASTRPV